MIEHDKLIEQLGDRNTSEVVKRLDNFAACSSKILDALSGDNALTENWGHRRFVLRKYLAVHIAWAIEQQRYTQSANQFYTTAGHLQTRYGTQLYLVFMKNIVPGGTPWRIVAAGPEIYALELPTPPEIPSPPKIPIGAEIVMHHDHILDDNGDRLAFLKDTPKVSQMCAVSGAIQWSLNRGLQLSQWYFGKMNYLVPLYLKSREDITLAPDAIAPIQVDPDRLLVRTVLPPIASYPNARVAVKRHDQLFPWLLAGWAEAGEDARWEDIDARTSPLVETTPS